MIVPIAAFLIVLIAALIVAGYKAKHRFVDHEPPPPDVRPEDRPMTARPDLTNPPIRQPEFDRRPWNSAPVDRR